MTPDALIDAIVDSCLQHEPKLLLPLLNKQGFREAETAATNILLLYDFLNDDDLLKKIVCQVMESADPDLCLNSLERLSSIAPRDEFFPVLRSEGLNDLFKVLGASPFLATILFTQKQLLRSLFFRKAFLRRRSETEMLCELHERIPPQASFPELQKELRLFKKREILRIAARDLSGKAGFQEVVEELSALATTTLKKACEISANILQAEFGTPRANRGEEAEFTVLGMGKLGGNELNFSSDIDLMYFYSTARGMTEGIKDPAGNVKNCLPLPTYFAKLANLVTKAINQPTEDGFVFRVDLGLRPEGASGDMAQPLDYAENYYESWGHSWERSALLKARPVAGSLKLGEQLLKNLEPFIYRKYLDYGMIEDLKTMKQKINSNLKRQREGEQNLKLGKGGIREIEFFIQTLQLIHSGKKPALREKNSLKSLAILRQEGILSPQDYQDLTEAYIFLRTVENRIQVYQEKQTHNLPTQPAALKALSRRCGFKEVVLFWQELEKHRRNVENIYRTLFYSGEEELEQAASDVATFIMDRSADPETVKELLAEKGFHAPETAYESLLVIRDGIRHVQMTQKARRLLHRVAPAFMQEILDSPEPERALLNTEKFFASLRSKTPVFALLAENLHLIHQLVSLFSTSQFLSHFFIKDPSVLDALASSAYAILFKDHDTMKKELEDCLKNAVDYEDKLHILRRFRHEEFLRIALNDIQNITLQENVTTQLSSLAEVCLEEAMAIARNEVIPRFGVPMCQGEDGIEREAAFAIVGLGKLGGRELNYHSDVDIIFIFETDGSTRPHADTLPEKFKSQSNLEYFSRLAQRIISIITLKTTLGHLFQVDTRLRPSGNQGPLVTSLNAFRQYHETSAKAWERQALAKARPVSGPDSLRQAIEKEIDKVVYQAALPEDFAGELCRLRKRMENEVAREGKNHFNIKMGRGGMVDVEFLTQYLQIRHGLENPEIKGTNTLKALEALHKAGFLAVEEFETLSDGYKFLRRLENKLRLIHDQSISELAGDKEYLTRLAKRLGYADSDLPAGELLLCDYQKITEGIRAVFNRTFEMTADNTKG
ncbi:MAG: bifunctional [glutamate--ammonia ligase]-adenylyl-L-tyrosine phosphorylase/[glutamate--ammonia-ligase] adenylyltransferase [Deltaproteobacteria bacterium]|nr:bifunctional [glutamate--ammonia ligase]-adenylyl-L-tyrosine phosphorylase/[glutamate--ammonia-ligase] adenylyltransferase [Deltaproteobacteria bacterium]